MTASGLTHGAKAGSRDREDMVVPGVAVVFK